MFRKKRAVSNTASGTTIDQTMIDLHMTEKTLAVLKKNPDALGIFKACNPNREMKYDEVEDNNGMFLYYRASTKTIILLYRDVTRARAEELMVDFEAGLFVPYEVLCQEDKSRMEYIEEWRARDEAATPFRKKLNTILYLRREQEEPENIHGAGINLHAQFNTIAPHEGFGMPEISWETRKWRFWDVVKSVFLEFFVKEK